MSDLRVITADGVSLEAAWDRADAPSAVVVLCHPHPHHGGTMNAPLIRAVGRHLGRNGAAVLRFNFRGVGASDGRWGGGRAEIDDVAATVAAAAAAYPGWVIGVAGWSFGAVMALRWQERSGAAGPYVGIAPPVTNELTPVLPVPGSLAPARRRFILGDRDQFVTVEALGAYAAAIDADLAVVAGSDHFFHFRDQRVAELAAEWLIPGPSSGDPAT